MKYSGEITLGNLVSAGTALVAVAVGWGVLVTRVDASDQRMAAQRTEFTQALQDTKEAIKELRADSKELQKAVGAITTDTALIRGRLAGNDGPSRK